MAFKLCLLVLGAITNFERGVISKFSKNQIKLNKRNSAHRLWADLSFSGRVCGLVRAKQEEKTRKSIA